MREKVLSSVIIVIFMDLVFLLGRVIRIICNFIIKVKVDGIVMLRVVFLNILLVCFCYVFVEGFVVVWDVFLFISDLIFFDFFKRFFCFWKFVIVKIVLGLGIVNVVCFIFVWYERFGCICIVVVKFFVL